MMAFPVFNISRWINVKVKELLVAFANFGQVILVISVFLGKLKLSATVSLLLCASDSSSFNFGEVMHLFT